MRIRLKKMGTTIDDEYLMMHIMNHLPSSYDSLIKNLEDRLDSIVDPLTIGMLRDKLSEKFEKIRKRQGIKDNESDDSNEDDERALFAKTFKGRCHKCGKFGHKAVDCRSSGGFKNNNNNNNNNNNYKGRANNSRGSFQGKCHHCRKYGHREVDCWEKHMEDLATTKTRTTKQLKRQWNKRKSWH